MTGLEISDKFAELESAVSAERGPFTLFALFMREEVPDRWDLMVSAPWTVGDRQEVVDYLVTQIKSKLGADQLVRLSRIIVIDPNNPAIQALNRDIQVEHGRVEVRDTDFFGQTVKQAYIITSKRREASAA